MKPKLRQTFKYPVITDKHRKFGDIVTPEDIIRADGDWRSYTPQGEAQSKNGIEPSDCFIQASQHSIATVEEEAFAELDNNYSARFNALVAFGTQQGGDPVVGAESIQSDGLVPEAAMPFSDDLKSWDDFHSWKGVDEKTVRALGKKYLETKTPQFHIIVEKEYPLATKYALLKRALMCSSCDISIWGQVDEQGNYLPKPAGVSDTHMVELVYIDNNNVPYIFDTYPPFSKQLPANYNVDFSLGWTVKKKLTITQKKILWELIKSFLFGQPAILEKLQPILNPMPYQWLTPADARHSIRLICDEEGLSVADKNLICQVINCESGFKEDAKNDNKDAIGRIVSSDWGLVQVNDHYHIGEGKDFPSVQFVLDNPEACVRWMIRLFKEGKLNLWSCYKFELYKKYTA